MSSRSVPILDLALPLFIAFSEDGGRITEDVSSENGVCFWRALSKDGFMILDEGRRTDFQLFMLFSEDGERLF